MIVERTSSHKNNLRQLIMLNFTKSSNIYIRTMIGEGTWAEWNEVIMGDSGWMDLPLEEGISTGSITGVAQYRKIGKTVYLRGDVKGISGANTLIGKLPLGYRPSKQCYFINATSGTKFIRICVTTSGDVKLEWVSDGTYEATWYDISGEFTVD